ncbi:MAG: methyltransferase domain-containing protein [Planctomycetota bacterium]
MPETQAPSPFDDPESYDLLFETLDFDIELYRSVVRENGGPVLDLACGTGRILLRLLQDGFETDGVDLFEPMLKTLAAKAAALRKNPNLYNCDLSNFKTQRKYKVVLCAFNAFAHNLTQRDQLSSLRCIHDHLQTGGVFVCHMSYPAAQLWSEPDGIAILEAEIPQPKTGGFVRIYDTRFKNPIEQTQQSKMEIQILDANRNIINTNKSETTVRWIYKPEFELLLRAAGYSRFDIYGDFDRSPLTRDSQQMIVMGWK